MNRAVLCGLAAVAVMSVVVAQSANDDDHNSMYIAFNGGQNKMGSSLATVTSVVLNDEVQAANLTADAWLGAMDVDDKCLAPPFGVSNFVSVRVNTCECV
jgi:hypothetical protein